MSFSGSILACNKVVSCPLDFSIVYIDAVMKEEIGKEEDWSEISGGGEKMKIT